MLLCVTSDTAVESTKNLCAELANNSTILRLSVVSTVSKSGSKEAFSIDMLAKINLDTGTSERERVVVPSSPC